MGSSTYTPPPTKPKAKPDPQPTQGIPMDIWIVYKGNTTVLHFTDPKRAAAHLLGKILSEYIIIKQEPGDKAKTVTPLVQHHDINELSKLIQAT